MTISSTGLTVNDRISKKKRKKDKKGRAKSAMPKTKSTKSYQEQINDNSFIMNEEDWIEASGDLSFDDIRVMVDKAVSDAYGYNKPPYSTYTSSYSNRYYVYKIWPDKIVVKRSYDNKEDLDLFLMMTYDIDGDTATLGKAASVDLGFVPSSVQPVEFMTAVREADTLSIDDPVFALRMVEESEEDADTQDPDDPDDDKEDDEDSEEDDGDDDVDDEEKNDDSADEGAAAVQEAALREDVASIAVQDFTESFGFAAIDASTRIIEAKDGRYIIKGMSLLGPKSKNNRSYSKDVRKGAIKVFEGIRAYCDHPAKGKEDETRGVRELIGTHKNVHFDETSDMLRSDLHLSPTSTVKDFIIPHAKTNPGIIGNSINASGKLSQDGTIVMEITRGRSVDIVSDPATTNGLFESVQSNKQIEKPEGGKEIMDITMEAVLKEEKLVDELRAHFREELNVEDAVAELNESLEVKTEENDELKEKVKEYEVKEARKLIGEEADQLIKEAKLPAESKDKELRELLINAADTDTRKGILARFEKVAESAKKGMSKVDNGKAPSLEYPKDEGDGGEGKLQESTMLQKTAAAFTSRR